MARYICEKCGAKFNEPFRETDDTGGWDSCPDCGNPDFEAAAQCVCCGEDFAYGSLVAGVLCKSCIADEATEDDYVSFAVEQAEAFAEFLVEYHAAEWKGRRHG